MPFSSGAVFMFVFSAHVRVHVAVFKNLFMFVFKSLFTGSEFCVLAGS